MTSETSWEPPWVDISEYILPGLVVFGHQSREPLPLYQQPWEELADRLNEEAGSGLPPRAGKILKEHEAAVHIHRSLRRYLGG